jgi:integrase
MLTAKQATEILGLEQYAVEQRRVAERLIAINFNSEWLYLAFQFGADGVFPRIEQLKTGKVVSIPVTPSLSKLIDETPPEQKYLIVSLEGSPQKSERASGIIRDLKKRANKLASESQDCIHIRDELRLYDMRGTAATELLRAGCSLNEIAVTTGWGLRHAGHIIE